MRNRRISLSLILIFFLMMSMVTAQEKVVYEHPTLSIHFEAPLGWKQLPRPEDKNTYEIVDPEGSSHVVVWYTTTEQSGRAYLQKMASMKDLVPSRRIRKK